LMLPNFTLQTELLMYGIVYPSMLSLHPPCHVFATDCPRLI